MNKANKVVAVTYFVLLVLALLAPLLGLYPVFLMKLLCFAIFCRGFQPAAGFYRPAVVRPRGVFRLSRLRHRLVHQGPEFHA